MHLKRGDCFLQGYCKNRSNSPYSVVVCCIGPGEPWADASVLKLLTFSQGTAWHPDNTDFAKDSLLYVRKSEQ